MILIVPEGASVDALLERAGSGGTGRRLLSSVESLVSKEAVRRLMAAVFLQGMREGVDRALAGPQLPVQPSPQAVPVEGPEPGANSESPGFAALTGESLRSRSPVQMVVERFRTEELRLPAMPEVTVQLNRLLSNPEYDLSLVIELIRRDLALTARVMKLAASPVYRLGGRAPRSLQEAIVRLGARELGKQLLAFSNRRLFAFQCNGRDGALRDLWHHGLATAVIAEYLAADVPGLHGPACFLHGLLHDIGRALLLQIFDRIEESGTRFGAEEVDRTIDSLHGQFGSALLQRWRFDESFSEVAMFHHQPQKSFSNMKLVACVALAGSLAVRAGFGRQDDPNAHVEPSMHPASSFLGLTAERLGGVDSHVRRQFEALGDLT